MTFERFFTKRGEHPFDQVGWEKTSIEIKHSNGSVLLKQDNVEFPVFWNQISRDFTVDKFFAGSANSKNREHSLKQLLNRVVNWYVSCGEKDQYFDTEQDKEIFRDELTYILLHQYAMFNSPVLFNCGVKDTPQVSACFILSAEDSMDSISENTKIEMDIFRRGSGAGTNHSNLRSSQEEVSTGGLAMGPLLPMQISDKIAKAVKSGGKTRRAALMKILDIDHGDIEDFITQKAEVERAARILVEAGHSADFTDPKGVYSLLGLQNFNESVCTFDTFMYSLVNNSEWALVSRKPSKVPSIEVFEQKRLFQGLFEKRGRYWYAIKEDKYYRVLKWVSPSHLYNLICESTWECADPGLQFYDTINRWHTCKADGPIRSSNPCSEYLFLDDTSCNLASLNLLKFWDDKTSRFRIKEYLHCIRIMLTAMDISVSNAFYPAKKLAIKTMQYRTLGLGWANLGALLFNKTLPYDSDEGRFFAGVITAVLQGAAYKTSAEIAEHLKPFERYEVNKFHIREVIEAHATKAQELKNTICNIENLADKEELCSLLDLATTYLNGVKDKPIRNAQVTVIAPVGTIGYVMGVDTTGIEPYPGLLVYKKLVGGGMVKLINPAIDSVLLKLGYSSMDIKAIKQVIENDAEQLSACTVLKREHLPLFQTALSVNLSIAPEAHLKMLAAVQPFISGGISKTVNLPSTATVEDIKELYLEAWKLGIKSVSIYRDGSKVSAPLSTKENKKVVKRVIPERRPLPKDRNGHTHEFKVGAHKGFLTLNFYPDTKELGEVFAEISKFGSTLNGFVDALAISISKMLQYGIPVAEIVNMYSNLQFEPAGFTGEEGIPAASSIPDYIARYIKLYLEENQVIDTSSGFEDSVKSGPLCTECGFLMTKTGTCAVCPNCGANTGCG